MRTLLESRGYLFVGDNECDDDFVHRSAISGTYYYRNYFEKPVHVEIRNDLTVVARSAYWPTKRGEVDGPTRQIDFGNQDIRRFDGRSITRSPTDAWRRHPIDLDRAFPCPRLPSLGATERRDLTATHEQRATGILHLGAHLGQEAGHYANLNKPVVWVEAMPDICLRLQERLKQYTGQLAICALLGAESKPSVTFNRSGNASGVSSSLFEFGPHGQGRESLWPEKNLRMVDAVELPMTTLDETLTRFGLDAAAHDFWVLDLQGAELLALQGAREAISYCRCIYTEVSLLEVYQGGAQWLDLKSYLVELGFAPLWEPDSAHDDVLFVREQQTA